jgi:hypothetical protein
MASPVAFRATVFAKASTSLCFVAKLREKSTCFASDIDRRTVTPVNDAISGSKLSGAFRITISV